MTITRQQFLTISGLRQTTLDAWLEEQWLLPGGTAAELTFTDADVARARLIRDLQEDFGVNDEGVGVILDLLDQLHGMRRVLRQLHQEFRDTGRAKS